MLIRAVKGRSTGLLGTLTPVDPPPQPRPYCRLREGEREGCVPTDGWGVGGVGMPRDGSRK